MTSGNPAQLDKLASEVLAKIERQRVSLYPYFNSHDLEQFARAYVQHRKLLARLASWAAEQEDDAFADQVRQWAQEVIATGDDL